MDFRTIPFSETEAWDKAIARFPRADVYYTRGYLAPLFDRGEGSPLLAVGSAEQGDVIHVTMIRQLSDLPFDTGQDAARIDLCSPYGLSGPVASKPDPDLAWKFWEKWCGHARSIGAVSEFLRFHPILETHVPFAGKIPTRLMNPVIYINLCQQDIRSSMTKTCKKNIDWAEKKGVEFEVLDPAAALDGFLAMYQGTMKRRLAADYYFFERDYFERLVQGLGPDLWMARAHHLGRTGAFGLFLRHSPTLHYHLGCSDHDMRSLCPTNLLIYRTALLAKERGLTVFHLGGRYQGQEGLLKFKQGFSNLEAEYHVGTVIHDQEACDRPCRRRASASQEPPGDFFPPYRSPL